MIELLIAELKAEHLQRAFSYVNEHYIKGICKYSAIKNFSTLLRHAFTILIENELSQIMNMDRRTDSPLFIGISTGYF